MKTLNKTEAQEQGYNALTTGYNLPSEQWMLDNVIKDMNRGSIDAVMVTNGNGVEVWRKQ